MSARIFYSLQKAAVASVVKSEPDIFSFDVRVGQAYVSKCQFSHTRKQAGLVKTSLSPLPTVSIPDFLSLSPLCIRK